MMSWRRDGRHWSFVDDMRIDEIAKTNPLNPLEQRGF
jgi:hypothetical protein